MHKRAIFRGAVEGCPLVQWGNLFLCVAEGKFLSAGLTFRNRKVSGSSPILEKSALRSAQQIMKGNLVVLLQGGHRITLSWLTKLARYLAQFQFGARISQNKFLALVQLRTNVQGCAPVPPAVVVYPCFFYPGHERSLNRHRSQHSQKRIKLTSF
jgi:hypothetical protein